MKRLPTVALSLWISCVILVLVGAANAQDRQGITYSVISDKDFQGVRRSIDVRLDRKASLEELRSIAMELKARERRNYERTFIAYYLPGMKAGSGAWATSHFDPEIEVKILGLTSSKEAEMVQHEKSQSRDIVGIWVDERPYAGSTLTLYRDRGKLYLESKYEDGSGSTDEMAESRTSNGMKLVEKGGNPHGEYFVLDASGDLFAGDAEGVFMKYNKIQ